MQKDMWISFMGYSKWTDSIFLGAIRISKMVMLIVNYIIWEIYVAPKILKHFLHGIILAWCWPSKFQVQMFSCLGEIKMRMHELLSASKMRKQTVSFFTWSEPWGNCISFSSCCSKFRQLIQKTHRFPCVKRFAQRWLDHCCITPWFSEASLFLYVSANHLAGWSIFHEHI